MPNALGIVCFIWCQFVVVRVFFLCCNNTNCFVTSSPFLTPRPGRPVQPKKLVSYSKSSSCLRAPFMENHNQQQDVFSRFLKIYCCAKVAFKSFTLTGNANSGSNHNRDVVHCASLGMNYGSKKSELFYPETTKSAEKTHISNRALSHLRINHFHDTSVHILRTERSTLALLGV